MSEELPLVGPATVGATKAGVCWVWLASPDEGRAALARRYGGEPKEGGSPALRAGAAAARRVYSPASARRSLCRWTRGGRRFSGRYGRRCGRSRTGRPAATRRSPRGSSSRRRCGPSALRTARTLSASSCHATGSSAQTAGWSDSDADWRLNGSSWSWKAPCRGICLLLDKQARSKIWVNQSPALGPARASQGNPDGTAGIRRQGARRGSGPEGRSHAQRAVWPRALRQYGEVRWDFQPGEPRSGPLQEAGPAGRTHAVGARAGSKGGPGSRSGGCGGSWRVDCRAAVTVRRFHLE